MNHVPPIHDLPIRSILLDQLSSRERTRATLGALIKAPRQTLTRLPT